MEGEITSIELDGLRHPDAILEIMIEEDPSLPLDDWLRQPVSGYEKVLWSIGRGTEIFRQRADGSREKAGIDDLVIGAKVLAWHIGYFVDTGIPLAGARMLVIVEAS